MFDLISFVLKVVNKGSIDKQLRINGQKSVFFLPRQTLEPSLFSLSLDNTISRVFLGEKSDTVLPVKKQL